MGKTVGKSLDDSDILWVPQAVDVNKVYQWLMGHPNQFDWKPDPSRKSYQRNKIARGEAIEAPVFYSPTGLKDQILILDGRHRIAATQSKGGTKMIIMIPENETAIFQLFV